MKKAIGIFVIGVLLFSQSLYGQKYHSYPIDRVNSVRVQLTDNFWLPKIQTVQNTTIQHALEKSGEEGRFENFLIAGGEMEGETRGAMPFDDTDVYKILEGASYSLLVVPNEHLEARIDSIIDIIAIGQEEDGYLTTWRTIDPQNPPADWVEPGDRWEYLEMSHELYNSGHLFEAAAAHYHATGKRNFLDIALKNADLLVETFGPDKIMKVPGHQIVETGLIDLYQITGREAYLELAKFFLDHRGDSTSHTLFGPYAQDHRPVTEQDEVVGHAVRAVYMYAGMTDISAIYHDNAYRQAVNDLWENMVYKKMYVTGGIGARHKGESFGENYELPNLTAYSETCAAIGSVYWNHRLFRLTGNAKYYDIIERTLFNGVITGLSQDGTKFFYPNPLKSDGEYTFNQGACTRKEWFDCSCCPTNLIRFIPSIPNLIYATEEDSLYINLFMSNEAKVDLSDTEVGISQKSDYPWDGNIHISVDPEEVKEFTLKLRIPGWARNDAVPGELYEYLADKKQPVRVAVNGNVKPYPVHEGYMEISRRWAKGDEIEISYPMEIRRVVASDSVEADRGKMAFEYGPFVYCGEEADNGRKILDIEVPGDMRMSVESRDTLLGGVNILTGSFSAEGNEEFDLQLIPYYAWSNRGIGKMRVWFPIQE